MSQGLAAAAEYRERVAVTAPTRIDWTFAVAKRSLTDPPPEWVGPDYDSMQQTYGLYGPDETKTLGKTYPLVLYISPNDQAKGWRR